MSTLTPNMNLIESTVNVDSGLNWETNLNASLTIIDGHNHSPGYGVQINPAGININSSLSFNNNSAIALQASVFTQQLSLSTLNAVYVKSDGNLYYNDGAGNSIQITTGGTVNATSSGISSGSATASFVSSVLVVNAASNTPANIQGGSILLGNNTPASKFLTLAPPAAMAANFTLTLPSTPAQTNVVTLDSSGNFSSTTWNAVGQNMTATGANAIAASRTRATGSTVAIGGVATSSSSGLFTTSSTSYVNATNLTVTISTSGRPVFVGLISDGVGSSSFINVGTTGPTGTANFAILNGSTIVGSHTLATSASGVSSVGVTVPSSALWHIDFPAAGTYTYKIQARSPAGTATAEVFNSILTAYEL